MHSHTCRERCIDNEQKQKFNGKCSRKAETENTDSNSTKDAAVYLPHSGHVSKDPHCQWLDVFVVERKRPRSSRTRSRWWQNCIIIHTNICQTINTCTLIHIHTCTHIYRKRWGCVLPREGGPFGCLRYTHIYDYICTSTHRNIYTCIHTYKYICIQTHRHTCTLMHTHKHTGDVKHTLTLTHTGTTQVAFVHCVCFYGAGV